ncbi:MAG: bifunctional N(6)-L-threonylcarbamoyladenine synthase/serine/threonine protein kinase [Promethearchaeota archaeon]
MPYILGIEGTAHSLGLALLDTESLEFTYEIQSQYQPESGGIHPREAARFMGDMFPKVFEQCILESGISFSELTGVAFSQGPGLGPCLRTVATTARTIALSLDIPLMGVNHCVAHIELGKKLTNCQNPLVIFASGGNTQIIILGENSQKYQILGETIDLALGNALDTFARELGLPHPGGPIIMKLAQSGQELIELPYTVKGMSLSFSGLVTAAIKEFKKENVSIEDLSFSFQEYAFGMLAEVTERALACTEKKELLLTGGVAANLRLREMLELVAKEHDATAFFIPIKHAGDNGAMIAWTGYLHHLAKDFLAIEDSQVIPRWRINEAKIPWKSMIS